MIQNLMTVNLHISYVDILLTIKFILYSVLTCADAILLGRRPGYSPNSYEAEQSAYYTVI